MSDLWERIQERAAPLRAVIERYGSDHGTRLAASLAYRAVFALAPLLLVAVSVAGFVYGTADAQARLVAEIQPYVGAESSALVFDLLEQAAASRNSTGIVGLLLMAWTASALFVEARGSLNLIFGSETAPKGGVGAWILRRVLALTAALSMGVVLLVVIGLGTAWGVVESQVDLAEPVKQVLGWLTPLAAWLILAGLFTIAYRFVPTRDIPWRAARIGGAMSAVGFTVASLVIGSYFSPERFSSTGFAGGFVLILFSVYVLAQIVLFGAEIIDVHLVADHRIRGVDAAASSVPTHAQLNPTEQGATTVGWFAAGLAVGAYLVARIRPEK